VYPLRVLPHHDDTTRKAIHVTICAPGAEALRAFCIHHGVTITAFLDGLSHVLEAEHVPVSIVAALAAARQIDACRRSREPAS
jgi:hypothetical protein